ncbi:hypothetical protein TrST_g7037 [Triparma strigata]|uniref:Adenylate cyclase-associated CAP C-terminal domain-containing protein n=1 Tax=Triparma strigata TaxID=1606541 RepID=A0A9W7AME7_9STRA|nr:hypothetical protein TrST_g7037 [Triparma strigata]
MPRNAFRDSTTISKMSKLHDEKYRNWDKLANELDTKLDVEESLEKEEASKSLGHDKAVYSSSQAEEVKKAEQIALLKTAMSKQKEMEDSLKLVVTNEDDDTNSSSSIIVDENYLKGKKVVVFRNVENKTYTVSSPLIKVFLEHCKSFTLNVNSNIITQHIEISNCSSLTLNVSQRCSTVQIDLSSSCTCNYSPSTFSGVDDRLYHAGATDLKVNYAGQTVECDYVKDGARQRGEQSKEEYQFAVFVNEGKLVNEPLTRIGNKFLTGDIKDEPSALTSTMITEKLKEVAQHKEEGNEAFKNGEYAQAVLFYTLGVEKVTPILPNEIYPMLLSNRSACFLKLGHHEKALKDASECVAVSPSNVKGLFRKGVSLHAMGQWTEACEVLTECLRLEPGNKQAKQARQFAEVKLQMDMRKRMGA